jgi:hypothetical protein
MEFLGGYAEVKQAADVEHGQIMMLSKVRTCSLRPVKAAVGIRKVRGMVA